MYTIKLKGSKTQKKYPTFSAYEEARSFVRSLIRRMVPKSKRINGGQYGLFDGISRNPTQLGNFQIVRLT